MVLVANVFLVTIQLFEGMKAFHGVDGKARLFRPMENMKRLNRSAVTMSLPVSDKVLCATCDSHGTEPTCVTCHNMYIAYFIQQWPSVVRCMH